MKSIWNPAINLAAATALSRQPFRHNSITVGTSSDSCSKDLIWYKDTYKSQIVVSETKYTLDKMLIAIEHDGDLVYYAMLVDKRCYFNAL